MSSSLFNITIEQQYQGLLERIVLSFLSTGPACFFLIINGILMFSLRSKPVFRYTCRYILLYNLLVADTAQLVVTQVLFLLAVGRVRITYAVCGTITTMANLTAGISPLILVIMSLERYVAVCYPLRHASIITIKNTVLAIIAAWAVSSLNNVTRNLFLIEYSYEKFGKVLMEDYCTDVGWIPNSLCDDYDRAYNAVVFVSAGLTVISSYTGVVIAAKSASTDKASALKARKTLLLHLVQLVLSLSYTFYYPLLLALATTVRRIVFVWVQDVIYVLFIVLPRCLTSLIYGLRDQTIRPVLLRHLFCRSKLSVEPVTS
ncbi:PREDICTED: olfactory receptor 2L5-like [Poecilia mexicana]|uniref:G-protein coupled receptors family 1 profile domain-containing protein n=1 Tax=Poecilia mexicana TaxID=48701 RepID=A0A3B3Y3H7_9TELE|nr:PREDICTED: olfactory receptor 2L5-like [Poecilia mexicana]